MKPYPNIKKLTLMSLLSLGLACSSLVASANDSNRGWHGHIQQHHSKFHHPADHRKRHHGYGHHKYHGHLKNYRASYKSGRHHYKPQSHPGHYVDTQRHDWGAGQYDNPGVILGLFSDNQNALYCD